jgi:hypothetical protein
MKRIGQLRASGAGDRLLPPALDDPVGRPRKTMTCPSVPSMGRILLDEGANRNRRG